MQKSLSQYVNYSFNNLLDKYWKKGKKGPGKKVYEK